MWDRGQQCEAENLLKRAVYGIGLPEQMKVHMVAHLCSCVDCESNF